ncbi:MAG: hypothetical protein ACK4WD_09615 [Flavobacteriales bacterium]
MICFFILANESMAQYEKDKERFNFRDYKRSSTDAYEPIISGLASFFIPGLGQIYCDETMRGFKFLGGVVGSMFISISGAVFLFISGGADLGYGLLIGGALMSTGIHIWSIIDAIRVAKVKNMAYKSRPRVGL